MIFLPFIEQITGIMVDLLMIGTAVIRYKEVITVIAINLAVNVQRRYVKILGVTLTAENQEICYLPEKSTNLIRLKFLI